MKKRVSNKTSVRTFNFQINLTNRVLYSFIALGILIAISVGVFAVTFGSNLRDPNADPYDMGHSGAETVIMVGNSVKSLQAAIDDGSIDQDTFTDTDTRCDVSGRCNTVYGNTVSATTVSANSISATQSIALNGVTRTSWPTSLPSAWACPSGTTPQRQEMGEWVYDGTPTYEFRWDTTGSYQADTCNGDQVNEYTCVAADNIRTCTDVKRTSSSSTWGGLSYTYYERTVTCMEYNSWGSVLVCK